nr:stc1 domain protein [Colletotrichum truncatum]KAF6796071.1 stc1 domain protein [Colletotrichum truncatum]
MSANANRPNGPRNFGQKVPERFRCDLGGEWKPFSSFSKRQQKIVTDKLERRIRIDAANTGMTCRMHSGEPVKEIQCEGPCNEIRVLDDFSKNNRSNGVYVCKFCQHWTNSQEPGYTPWAAPSNMLDPFEEMDDFEARMPTEPDGLTDPVGGEMDGPSLRAGLASTDKDGGRSREIFAPSIDTESLSSARRTAGSTVTYTTSMSRVGDLSASMANLWFNNADIAKDLTDSKIEYNAWDSDGRQHRMAKSPTVQSRGSSVTMGSAAGEYSNGRENSAYNYRLQGSNRSRGFGSAPDRQGDRKQLTEKEHRERQKALPKRPNLLPYQDEDEEDEESE